MKREATKKARKNSKGKNGAFANGVRGKYFGRVTKDSPVFFRTEAESKRIAQAGLSSTKNRPARIKPNKKHILSA